MTRDEQLLTETAKFTVELAKDRNDILVGAVAALLDLYRISIQHGHQSKDEAIARLTIQKESTAKETGGAGAQFLGFLIDALATGKLDSAKWLREPPAGSA